MAANNFRSDPAPFSLSEKEDSLGAKSQRSEERVLSYPKPILTEAPLAHRCYLKSRQFDPDELTRKYHLKFTYNYGDYRFKIIVPIRIDHVDVSWIAADVIRNGSCPPYLKCPIEKSVRSANDCLYNIDSVGSVAVIVEGITDIWRCGDGFVATMTKSINSAQIQQLVDRDVEKVFVMYDADAKDRAKIACSKLSDFFKTEMLLLSEGDPADLSSAEVLSLRKDIFI